MYFYVCFSLFYFFLVIFQDKLVVLEIHILRSHNEQTKYNVFCIHYHGEQVSLKDATD